MKTKKEAFLTGMLLWVIAAILTSGCSSNKDAITQAEKTMAVAQGGKTEAAKPDFAEIRKIPEEGFIYGLPIVMNYAGMYEFSVDKTSSQYKAPFNQILNEHRVFTYEDTAIVTPNSDTPYSSVWLAGYYILSSP